MIGLLVRLLSRLHRQAGRAPFRQSVFQAAGFEAARPEQRHRFIGEDAIWSAAVSDDRLVRGEFGKSPFELAERYVEGSRQMAERIFVLRSNVEHGHKP